MWCFVEASVTQRDRLIQAAPSRGQVFQDESACRDTDMLLQTRRASELNRAMQLKSPHGGWGLGSSNQLSLGPQCACTGSCTGVPVTSCPGDLHQYSPIHIVASAARPVGGGTAVLPWFGVSSGTEFSVKRGYGAVRHVPKARTLVMSDSMLSS